MSIREREMGWYYGEGRLQQWDHDIARLHRRIARQPEPLPEDFQERLLITIRDDPEFCAAMRVVLGVTR